MKISNQASNGNKLSFNAEGITVAFANAFRRYAMVKVPILAIGTAVFYDNITSIFDEYLSHRLGLIPLVTPSKLPKEMDVILSLDVVGPKIVLSKDLKSSDKEIVPARDEIPIINMKEGQNLRLEGKVQLGTGKEHAKFQAGIVSYGYEGDKFRFKVESFYQMEPSELAWQLKS
ncbi:DNA-directed RNA polymerase subunit D [Candidatus Micrarchaeota archaeon]|nr:DNA-directed RNA polymerase subunit D [Candidatus Micrarchaeota archaeon]